MILMVGNCPGGWLCTSWEWLAQSWLDTAFYGGLAGFVLLWVVVRAVRGKRHIAEAEVR